MKRTPVLIVCLLFLFLMAIPTVADNSTQSYDLNALGDNTLVFTVKNEPTFWERPTLLSGEYSLETGKLIVQNNTSVEQKIGLRTVALPYDNEEALRYLNHVHITVSSNDTILYDGLYSRINDDVDFTMNTVLPANAAVEYTIDLRCDYTYIGDGFSSSDLITWEFYAVQEVVNDADDSSRFSNPALLQVLVACGVALLLLAGVFLYDSRKSSH